MREWYRVAVNGVGSVAEHALAVVRDLRRLAVHHLRGAHDLAAEQLADALVAETHAEHRDAGRSEHPDRVVRHPGVLGMGPGIAGTGRDEHRVGLERDQRVDRQGVVTVDDGLGAELTEVLHEVVDERVVVVDHEHAWSHIGTVPGRRPR